MSKSISLWLRCGAAIIAIFLSVSSLAVGATQYVITNDDLVPKLVSGISIYSVAPDGSLGFPQFVATFGNGINGGFFGLNRLKIMNSGNQQCVFASEAITGEVAGVDLNTGETTLTSPSLDDAGTSNGVGLAMNGPYLYASYTDPNTIGTFALQDGC